MVLTVVLFSPAGVPPPLFEMPGSEHCTTLGQVHTPQVQPQYASPGEFIILYTYKIQAQQRVKFDQLASSACFALGIKKYTCVNWICISFT